MDRDGYPEEHELAKIKAWKPADGKGLLEYVAGLWHWENYAWQEDGNWHFATGGWSGNEELIGAMQENNVWWFFHWYSSTRGGKYVFQLIDRKPEKKGKL
jgi:hypothetical protein